MRAGGGGTLGEYCSPYLAKMLASCSPLGAMASTPVLYSLPTPPTPFTHR